MKGPATASSDDDFPGRRLGVAGLVLALVLGLVGVVVSTIALIQSSRAGRRNPAAIAGILLGVLSSVVFGLVLSFVLQSFAGTVGPCAGREPGTYEGGGVTFECGR